MEILFLGTGAADWEFDVPNISGIRRMSSILIDRVLLIDPAPSSYRFFEFLQGDPAKISDVLITHSHGDHLNLDSLRKFAEASKSSLRLWCHTEVKRMLEEYAIPKLELHDIAPYEAVKINEYQILPLTANHSVVNSAETALHYLIEKDGKKLFYGCDGAWFLSDTWEHLRKQTLDCAILDATSGDFMDALRLGTHNSVPMLRLLKQTMSENGLIREDAPFIASHLAKTLHPSIDETAEMLAKDGIIAAYDGLKINI